MRRKWKSNISRRSADYKIKKTHVRTAGESLEGVAGRHRQAGCRCGGSRLSRREDTHATARGASRDYTKVRAPYDGTITARFADPGALIQVATSSATTAIPALYDHGSQHGPRLCQRATGRLALGGPRQNQGRPGVQGIARAFLQRHHHPVHVGARSFDTQFIGRSRPTESDHALRPGTFAEMVIGLREIPNALVLPPQAVISGANGKSLFIVDQGRAKSIPIQTGITDGHSMEITSGLRGDEEVVVVGKRQLLAQESVHASPFHMPDAKPAQQKFERRSAGVHPSAWSNVEPRLKP